MAAYAVNQAIVAAKGSEFHSSVTWATTQAAIDVENEDPGTANHANRITWAVRWRRGQIETPVETYVSMVLENATIAGNIGGTFASPSITIVDADVQFQVNSLVSRFAALP